METNHPAYLPKYNKCYEIWDKGYKEHLQALIEMLQVKEVQIQTEQHDQESHILESERDEREETSNIEIIGNNDNLQEAINQSSSDLQVQAQETTPSPSENSQKQPSKKKVGERQSQKMTIRQLVHKAARMSLDKAVVKVLREENIVQGRDEHDITEIGAKIVTAILEEISKTPGMDNSDVSSSSDSDDNDSIIRTSPKRKRVDS
jgi:hypothetical protein